MLERALRICPSATGVVLASDVGADPPRKRYGVVLIEGFHSLRASSTSPDGVTDSQPIVRRDGHSGVTFRTRMSVPAAHTYFCCLLYTSDAADE